jgi:4-hydroxy-3-methylbut-2-enyl diphosphate reductase
MRLVETARRGDALVERVDSASDIDPGWLVDAEHVGVMSGAAVPEELVQQVVGRLSELARDSVEIESMPHVDERMHFALPSELRQQTA